MEQMFSMLPTFRRRKEGLKNSDATTEHQLSRVAKTDINMADYSRLSVVGIFTLFAVLTVKDLFIAPTQSTSSNTKEIPVTRVGVDKFIGPTLKVLYWWVSLCHRMPSSAKHSITCVFVPINNSTWIFSYSCGYKKAFEQYANLLQEKYPEIIVTGDNYQPSSTRTFLAQAVVSFFFFKYGRVLNDLTVLFVYKGFAEDGSRHVHCPWNQPLHEFGLSENTLLVAVVFQQQDLCVYDDFLHGQCPWRSVDLNWSFWNVLQW